MERCLELARRGMGHVSPNPLVGAVIVHNGAIIGEGFHRELGKAHAEVHAIESVSDKELLKDATLYVNLEPCAHHGKTPPCAPLVVSHGIPRVVIANVDPFDQVNGRGIELMRQSGTEVVMGVLEDRGREVNRRFFTFHEKKRPYIILKWAQSQDGFMDSNRAKPEEGPAKITNEEMDIITHQWRTEEDAILVGARTVLMDNPNLTVRHVHGRNPLRILLDPEDLVSGAYNIFNHEAPTLVFSNGRSKNNLEYIHPRNHDLLTHLMEEAYRRGIGSILVEGGSYTHRQFIQAGLWDELRIITHNDLFLHQGIQAPAVPEGRIAETFRVGAQVIQYIRNTQ